MDRRDGKGVEDWSVCLGSRCLVIEDQLLGYVTEVKVLEVSPAGRVKFRYPSGHERWEDKNDYLLIERLKD